MADNRHIKVGTVLSFVSPKGVPAYLYVARRPRNANYGLGYLFVANDVDLDAGLHADDAVTCVQMGFKATAGTWPVVAQQAHHNEDWPIPPMYMDMPGLEGKVGYRLDTFGENVMTVVESVRATAEECAGHPEASAFLAGAVPYYFDKVLALGHGRFGDMAWWRELRASESRGSS